MIGAKPLCISQAFPNLSLKVKGLRRLQLLCAFAPLREQTLPAFSSAPPRLRANQLAGFLGWPGFGCIRLGSVKRSSRKGAENYFLVAAFFAGAFLAGAASAAFSTFGAASFFGAAAFLAGFS